MYPHWFCQIHDGTLTSSFAPQDHPVWIVHAQDAYVVLCAGLTIRSVTELLNSDMKKRENTQAKLLPLPICTHLFSHSFIIYIFEYLWSNSVCRSAPCTHILLCLGKGNKLVNQEWYLTTLGWNKCLERK